MVGGILGGADTSLNDTLRFTDTEVGIGVNVFLGAGFVQTLQADRPMVAAISGFENAVGTGYADALIGSDANNILDGGFNADWHVGGGGADTFRSPTPSTPRAIPSRTSIARRATRLIFPASTPTR